MIFPIMSDDRHRPGLRDAWPTHLGCFRDAVSMPKSGKPDLGRVAFRARFGASRGSTVPKVLSGLARPSPRSCRTAARNRNETSFLYRS